MDRKKAIIKFYNEHVSEYEKRTKAYLSVHILKDAELFIKNLAGKNILDLGCGPGRDSLFFRNQGFNPLCIDISPTMIKICKEKGLEARVVDFEHLEFKYNSFDGIWAYTSLLHSPKKKFVKIIKKIANILKDKGIFYLGMKEGDFEGWVSDKRYEKVKKFYSLYRDEEIGLILSNNFDIFHNSKVSLEGNVYLNYLCRKR